MEALSTQAVRILKLFGSKAERVVATCGPEQEYFLIDRQLLLRAARPDHTPAARSSARSRPRARRWKTSTSGTSRARAGLHDGRRAASSTRSACPVKTRHNEVAPSQYEVAPIFENANVATDHQMMTMEVLKRVAPKYGLACLLHEKPFAGVNGSGKHLNWSMSDDHGNNLLNPGDTPHDNIQFLVFCAAVLRAVDKFQGLLRMSIASAGNDHRLGANEAPPAIISIFLGDMLTDIFAQIEKGAPTGPSRAASCTPASRCCRSCRATPATATARRPFAFTGNKFEFRAVASEPDRSRSRTSASTSPSPSRSTPSRPSSKAARQGRREARRRRRASS